MALPASTALGEVERPQAAKRPRTRGWGQQSTGKEEDVEVGLQYFGKRYYAPALNRWVSADPLAVHVPGDADLNSYAYVRGMALKATDPLGLDEESLTSDPTNIEDQQYAEQMLSDSNSVWTEGGKIHFPTPAGTSRSPESGSRAFTSGGTAAGGAGGHQPELPELPRLELTMPGRQGESGIGPTRATEHEERVLDLIGQYRDTSSTTSPAGKEFGPAYYAWDRAREDYRLVSLRGGEPALRDAEHFLFRYWLSSNLGQTQWIPRGLPVAIPDSVNPRIPMDSVFMEDFHDRYYNLARSVADKFLPIAPTTPEMLGWEKAGYDYGYCAGGMCGAKQAHDQVINNIIFAW